MISASSDIRAAGGYDCRVLAANAKSSVPLQSNEDFGGGPMSGESFPVTSNKACTSRDL